MGQRAPSSTVHRMVANAMHILNIEVETDWTREEIIELAKEQGYGLNAASKRFQRITRPKPAPPGIVRVSQNPGEVTTAGTDEDSQPSVGEVAATSPEPAGDAAVQKVDALAWIDIKLIHGNKDNPRRWVGDVSELAASIREQGLLQPIVVAPDDARGGYVVLAGHRRLAALQQLRAPRALCLIRFPKNAPEAIALMLVENGQRVAVTPMEEARAMQRLLDAGMTQVQIARKIGKDPSYISGRVALLHLSPADQDLVERGVLSVGEATRLGRRTRNAPKGKGERPGMRGWHFGHDHPLANKAAALCSHSTHSTNRRIGAGACGQCWEQAIREDERTTS